MNRDSGPLNQDIGARAKDRCYSGPVKRAQERLDDAEVEVERLRKERDRHAESFRATFNKSFKPGDRIRYYDGWDMRTGTFEYLSAWHVYVKTDNGVSVGLPFVIDTDWEHAAPPLS